MRTHCLVQCREAAENDPLKPSAEDDMVEKRPSAESSRRQLRRAACLTQAFRDALIPEVAAKVEPFAKLLEGPAEALEWACPPPDGELSEQQRAEVERARGVIASLLSIAKSNPNDYAVAELILAEISESLSEAG